MSSPVMIALLVVACSTLQVQVGAVSERRLLPTATSPPTLADLCQLSPYNIKNLTREKYWFAYNVESLIHNLQCFGPPGSGSAETCSFYIAFCHPLPHANDTAPCPEGAAVCQISKNSNGNISSYSLGQFSNTTQFYESNGTVDGGFYIDLVNGSKPTWDSECVENSTGVTTRIVFTCNSTQQWTSQNLTGIIDVAYSEPCTFTITLPYAGACRPLGPTTSSLSIAPSPTTSTSPTSSSSSVKPTNSTASKSTATAITTTVVTTSTTPNSTVSTSSLTSVTSTVTANTTLPAPATTTRTFTPTVTASLNVTTSTPVVSPTPKPPTSPPVTTTTEHNTPQPSKNYLPVVHGLTAGLVIFALLSVAFLLMLLYACRLLYVKGGQYRRVSNNDDM